MCLIESQSSYLKKGNRLADVVAALQVMGTYKFASREIQAWEKSIGRSPSSASSWLEIFSDHPEFFRIKDKWVSLVWRRASEKTYDTRSGKEITPEEVAALPKNENLRISRAPLSPDQVTALIEVAIKIHAQAIARRAELRWWVPVLVGAIGIAIGALIKS